MSITRRLLERRTAQPFGTGDVIPPNSLAGFGAAGSGPITDQGALAIIAVWACVSLLADAVSTLPIGAFRRANGASAEITPKPSVLLQPFVENSIIDWLVMVMVSLLLRGNFYALVVERDRLLRPVQLMPLHPDKVRVGRDSKTAQRVYRINFEPIAASEIVHIPGLMLPGAVAGLNPIEYARQGLALAKSTEAFGRQFFDNGTHMSGVISAKGDLNETETLALAQAWQAMHQGVGKAHLPAVLTGGAEWTQLSVNPDDAQFLETRKFQRSEIAMLFRTPPHMIGDTDRTTSWGTGIEQMEIGFVINTLRPWLKRIEWALSALLPLGTEAKFNLAGRLRGDTLQRFQAYTLARNGGWLNVDEIREKEDMAPLPDGLGTDYLQPLNFIPLGSAPAVIPPEGNTP